MERGYKKATSPQNYISVKAVDNKSNYREDIQLARDIGLNAFRFGIEWSIIEPSRGEFSGEAINYYHDYIDEVKENGMEPVVTLWHFTTPKWFSENGGWTLDYQDFIGINHYLKHDVDVIGRETSG